MNVDAWQEIDESVLEKLVVPSVPPMVAAPPPAAASASAPTPPSTSGKLVILKRDPSNQDQQQQQQQKTEPKVQKTASDREKEYQEARNRIFNAGGKTAKQKK